jgi:hypothetical protein
VAVSYRIKCTPGATDQAVRLCMGIENRLGQSYIPPGIEIFVSMPIAYYRCRPSRVRVAWGAPVSRVRVLPWSIYSSLSSLFSFRVRRG